MLHRLTRGHLFGDLKSGNQRLGNPRLVRTRRTRSSARASFSARIGIGSFTISAAFSSSSTWLRNRAVAASTAGPVSCIQLSSDITGTEISGVSSTVSIRARRSGIWSRKPVAITVIFTSSPIRSSSTAPKMMFASSCAAAWISDDASFTSRELQRARTGDVDQDSPRSVDRSRFQQRRRHRRLRRFYRAIRARAHRRAHHRVAHAGHRRLHIGKVAVDDPRNRDDVADTLHALPQHIVGNAEALKEARVLRHHQQLLVGDHDHRVHAVDQLLHARARPAAAAACLQTQTAA